MDWTNESILQFLRLYKSHPCIWDTKQLRQTRNRDRVNEAWQDIQKNMSILCTIPQLKKKKESLMSAYRAYKTKIKNSTAVVGGTAYKPSWFAFATMDSFLSTVYLCNNSNWRNQSELVADYVWDYKKGFSQQARAKPSDGADKKNNPGSSKHICDDTSKNIPEIQLTTMQDDSGLPFMTIEPLRLLDQRSSTDSTESIVCDGEPLQNDQSAENQDAQLDETNTGEEETPRKRKRQSFDIPQDDSSQPNEVDDECETITKLWAKKLRKLPEDRRDDLIYKINSLVYKECVEYRHSENVEVSPVQVKEESTSDCYFEESPKSDEDSSGFVSVKTEPEDS